MKYPMFCYRDLKASEFSPPMIQVNEATARRDFDMRLHSDKSMGFAPADFELFYVGEFDSDTGSISSVLPEFIVNGGELF